MAAAVNGPILQQYGLEAILIDAPGEIPAAFRTSGQSAQRERADARAFLQQIVWSNAP